MEKSKVLVLTGALPYPLVTGAKIRTFNLLKTLTSEFDISLLTVVTDKIERESIGPLEQAGITCRAIYKPGLHWGLKKAIDAISSYLLPQPYLVRHYDNKSYRRILETLLAENRYDVIHCDSISMTSNLRGLDKSRLILTQHNMEQLIWQGYAEHAGNPAALVFYRNQYRKVKKLERNLDRVYGHIVTVSENDKRLLSEHFPPERIAVVENGVDPEAYTNSVPVAERSGVVFTGSLDWHPNIDGLVWFAYYVYPLLRSAASELRTNVVGRKPTQRVRDLLAGRTAMNLHADVPKIQPYLHAARVMMVPLRIGGGSRLKILEAMASGVPVVSTTKGAEGLEVTAGENILIEDDPQRFAKALLEVIWDDELHLSLIEKGMHLIRSRYSWKQVARPQAELWRRIADA